jgi:hypothetical protein
MTGAVRPLSLYAYLAYAGDTFYFLTLRNVPSSLLPALWSSVCLTTHVLIHFTDGHASKMVQMVIIISLNPKGAT